MFHVASVCTPCCMLVGVHCAKFETGQTFSYVQTDATTLMGVVRQQCCVRWHGALHSRKLTLPADGRAHFQGGRVRSYLCFEALVSGHPKWYFVRLWIIFLFLKKNGYLWHWIYIGFGVCFFMYTSGYTSKHHLSFMLESELQRRQENSAKYKQKFFLHSKHLFLAGLVLLSLVRGLTVGCGSLIHSFQSQLTICPNFVHLSIRNVL